MLLLIQKYRCSSHWSVSFVFVAGQLQMSWGKPFPTRLHVCRATTQISLRIHGVWSVTEGHSVGSQGSKAASGDSKDSDQLAQMRRRIWVLVVRTCILVGNTVSCSALRKHSYSNIMKILPPKNEKNQINNSDIFHISAQNIVCGYSLEPPRRGGSNEYPQTMFLSRVEAVLTSTHKLCFWAEIRKII